MQTLQVNESMFLQCCHSRQLPTSLRDCLATLPASTQAVPGSIQARAQGLHWAGTSLGAQHPEGLTPRYPSSAYTCLHNHISFSKESSGPENTRAGLCQRWGCSFAFPGLLCSCYTCHVGRRDTTRCSLYTQQPDSTSQEQNPIKITHRRYGCHKIKCQGLR